MAWTPAEVLFLLGIGIVIVVLVASDFGFDSRRGGGTGGGQSASDDDASGTG